MKRQIGLDFGTTTTVITYRDHDDKNKGDTKPVMFDGTDYIPTLILLEGEIINKRGIARHHAEAYGRDADNADAFHSFLKRNFKMNLISENPAEREEAQELTRKFFLYLYRQYSAKALEKKDDPIAEISTVVTYPAKFPDDVQLFLKEAAEKAGFRNVVLLDESKAAMAFSLIYDTGSIKEYVSSLHKDILKVMLIDMGAGTTDIAIFQYDAADPSNFQHLCSWPENASHNFGGREIDEILGQFYQQKLGEDAIISALYKNDPVVAKKLLTKKVKDFKDRTISPLLAESMTVAELPSDLQDIADDMDEDPGIDLNRSGFEALLKEYLPQFPELVQGALQKAGLTGGDMDMVILTGGHSQWYFVKDALAKLGISSKAVFSFKDPHMVVSKGAAWYVEPPKKANTPPVKTTETHSGTNTGNAHGSSSAAAPQPSSFVPVTLLTSYGAEAGRLSVDPQRRDLPVTLSLIHRPFSRQFRPDSVIRNSETKITVAGYQDDFCLRFSSTEVADIWYKKLTNLSRSNTKTASYSWDTPSQYNHFIFGYVESSDADTAKIVFNKPIPRENRLLFFDVHGFLLTDRYFHVHTSADTICIKKPSDAKLSDGIKKGNVVLALAGSTSAYPSVHWNFGAVVSGKEIRILHTLGPARIILKRESNLRAALKNFYIDIDGKRRLVMAGHNEEILLKPGRHDIETGQLVLRPLYWGGPMTPRKICREKKFYTLASGEKLVFTFDGPPKFSLPEVLNDTSSPLYLELK